MQHPGFFLRSGPIRLADLAERLGANLASAADPEALIADVKPLGEAGAQDLTFLDNRKYMAQLAETRAGACLIAPAFADRVPPRTAALLLKAPYRGFAMALQLFYPDALQPKAAMAAAGEPLVHPSARVAAGALVEPGAVIGREAEVGRATTVAAGALIGYRVVVGEGCYIGPGVSVTHAIVGNRVILHAGVRIGQDGFGFAMGPQGHLKVPQIGRVLLHDDVEIGANSCVDRKST